MADERAPWLVAVRPLLILLARRMDGDWTLAVRVRSDEAREVEADGERLD